MRGFSSGAPEVVSYSGVYPKGSSTLLDSQ